VRFQDRLNFHAPLDPEKPKGEFPMSDFPSDAGDGALFKNREKSKPSQPDYFGKAEIEGRKYRISAWIKESKKEPGQKALGSADEEVTVWFRENQHYGFMVLASKGYLGGEGRGFASAWRFTELPTPDGAKPTDEYMLWGGNLFVRPKKKPASPENKTPSRKTGTPRPGKPGHSRPGIPGHSGKKARKSLSRNSGTSLENACHAVGSASVELGRAEGCGDAAQTTTAAATPKRTGPLPGRRAAPYRVDSSTTCSQVSAEAARPQQRSQVAPESPECDPPVAVITSPPIAEVAERRKRMKNRLAHATDATSAASGSDTLEVTTEPERLP
jgi:hypothetical protein